MNKEEWEIKFYSMVDHVEELQFDMVKKWLGEDEFRIEALASALARDEIIYYMSGFNHNYTDLSEGDANKLLVELPESKREFPFRDYMTNDVKGYGRVIWFKKFLYDLPEHYQLRLDAPSFKKWLNKAFPLEPDSVSISELEGPVSDELKIALECSKKLYPVGYRISTEHDLAKYRFEKDRIEKELKDVVFSDGKTREAVVKMINPEPKPPHKKK